MMESFERQLVSLGLPLPDGPTGLSSGKRKRSREEKERRKEEKRRKREVAGDEQVGKVRPQQGVESAQVTPKAKVTEHDEDVNKPREHKKRRKTDQVGQSASTPDLDDSTNAKTAAVPATPHEKEDRNSEAESHNDPPATQLKTLSQAGIVGSTKKQQQPSTSAHPRAESSAASKTNLTTSINPFQGKRTRRANSSSQEGGKLSDSLLTAQLRTPEAMNDWLASNFIKKSELLRLEKEGILKLKKGKFTETEKAAMRKALGLYQKLNRMDDDELVNRIMTKTREKSDDREESRNFWMDVAAAVPGRPIPYVQAYLRRAYDPKGHKGKWLPDEDAMLVRAYDLHPNEWSKISDIVERTTHDCRDRWTKELQHRDTRSTGHWTEEEERKLVECVKNANRSLGQEELSSNDIAWDVVVQEMGGIRSVTQCRVKWRDGLLPRELRKGKGKKDKENAGAPMKVVKRIQQLGIKSEEGINWEVVSDCAELADLSVKQVRNAFANTKRSVLRRRKDADKDFEDLLPLMHDRALKNRGSQEAKPTSRKSKEMISSEDDRSDSEVDHAEGEL
ncbi:hypothetical protein IAR55_003141 [Kwoniella newhampshirensis]|uniref:RNA polymerase I termination factor n=1 Tax=Kwoniella newhampshirensis TaxID=1651941 RepID=A0AAW0Z1I0_9TREE